MSQNESQKHGLLNQTIDQAKSVRAISPDVAQRAASEPNESVCVNASAGTGKTKVLTDRVLRLMLPRANGAPGTAPHRILCLTFTKAGANEMLIRVHEMLADWAVASDEKLTEFLEKLNDKPPTQAEMVAARQLFAKVIDTPGGLKIMTIHGFCQSVLGRFPLEAGLPPNFEVIEEAQAKALMQDAINETLSQDKRQDSNDIAQALRNLALIQNEDQFKKVLEQLSGERLQLARYAKDARAFYQTLCARHNVAPTDTINDVLEQACTLSKETEDALRSCLAPLIDDAQVTNQKFGLGMKHWLDDDFEGRMKGFDAYKGLFLKKDDDFKKNPCTAKFSGNNQALEDIIRHEANRVFERVKQAHNLQFCQINRDLMMLGGAMTQKYSTLKAQKSVLDYDDLILRTKALFEMPAIAPWILFKLDGGIDHILVDEAQDTSPEQWDVITKLCDDFFDGMAAHDEIKRTIFVVGDQKQSIYSFQRAAPEEFRSKQNMFKEIADAKMVRLSTSFRSSAAVLRFVDQVFAPEDMRQGLEDQTIAHTSHRRGQAGHVELWPLETPDEKAEIAPWEPPTKIHEIQSGSTKLAARIAEKIESWIGNADLPAYNRKVQAQDIMILVRTRTAIVGQLMKALKQRGIPVSGADKMVLGNQIAVMDLFACARFALLPDDDLSLAEALKSPLIGMNDSDLEAYCIGRKGPLWLRVKERAPPAIVQYLQRMIINARRDRPFDFFNRLLQVPCPADEISGLRAIQKRLGEDALDPLDECLNNALSYEKKGLPGLQNFMVWQTRNDITIKREMEEAGKAVRIMTVHGSKGLQAPIVILPDTVRGPSSRQIDRLIWPDKSQMDVPLWAPNKEVATDYYNSALTVVEQKYEEEYRRLLYVALTRAEDQLYIAGYQGYRKPIDETWHNQCLAAMAHLDEVKTKMDEQERIIHYIADPRTADPDRQPKTKDAVKHKDITSAVPPWLLTAAPAEQFPPRPMIPSRLGNDPRDPQSESQTEEMRNAMPFANDDTPARSPLQPLDSYRFQRGNLTHLLLQTLPDLPPEKREAAAKHYLETHGRVLPAAIRADIFREVFAILSQPEFSALFGANSIAEIPVTGFVKGRLISAQIDRLVVSGDKVMIVDYKTNRPPPRDVADVAQIYINQMNAYCDIVAEIYKEKTVEAYLLWTDGPFMMKMPT